MESGSNRIKEVQEDRQIAFYIKHSMADGLFLQIEHLFLQYKKIYKIHVSKEIQTRWKIYTFEPFLTTWSI
jgi:hypothetical protein